MTQRSGFTLVELSIVLVIIGLLIGGILVGQSLIDSARVNAQVRQLQQFDIATNNFITNFKSLPGENPALYNGAAKATAGITSANVDMKLGDAGSYYPEGIFFFSDLSESKMLAGHTYASGFTLDSFPEPAIFGGPKFKSNYYGGAFKVIVGVVGDASGNVFWAIDSSMNPMNWGRDRWPYSEAQGGSALDGVQALALDKKLDDGKPLTGNVRPFSDNMGSGGISAPADQATFPFWVQDGVSDGIAYHCVTASGSYNSNSKNACGLAIKAEIVAR